MDDLCTAMFVLDPWWAYFAVIFDFCFQTALLLISGKDGVMDLIYGGYSF